MIACATCKGYGDSAWVAKVLPSAPGLAQAPRRPGGRDQELDRRTPAPRQPPDGPDPPPRGGEEGDRSDRQDDARLRRHPLPQVQGQRGRVRGMLGRRTPRIPRRHGAGSSATLFWRSSRRQVGDLVKSPLAPLTLAPLPESESAPVVARRNPSPSAAAGGPAPQRTGRSPRRSTRWSRRPTSSTSPARATSRNPRRRATTPPGSTRA
jgi:hypothetical protein